MKTLKMESKGNGRRGGGLLVVQVASGKSGAVALAGSGVVGNGKRKGYSVKQELGSGEHCAEK